MKPIICILTGPCGAGKTTIANRLAEQFQKSARVDADYLRHSIKRGRVRPWGTSKETFRQLKLSAENVCFIAKNFAKYGFNVFIDDVLESKESIDLYLKNFRGYKVFIILLMPNEKVLQRRDKLRPPEDIMGQRALDLHKIFAKRLREKEKRWHIIDSSNQTTAQTTKEIMKIIRG